MKPPYAGSTRLSFIVPTTGRATLRRAIDSIMLQPLVQGDEIVVVGEFNPPSWLTSHPHRIHIIEHPKGNNWGCTERRIAIAAATGTRLVFVDDDDAMLPGAIPNIRRATDRYPDRPIMFRMVDPNGAVLWSHPTVEKGNHGSPCFVPPNIKAMLGDWSERYEGDFDFCTSTLAKYPDGALVWDASIIYACRDQVGIWAASMA